MTNNAQKHKCNIGISVNAEVLFLILCTASM